MAFKIKEIEIHNFKDLRATKVEIGGNSFAIIGKNGAGKSSLIQAMQLAFNSGSIPPEPVTIGEDRSSIKLVVFDPYDDIEYTISVSFSQTNKSGTVIVKNKNGEKVSTNKSWISKMFKANSFDISRFLRESSSKQIEMVRGLCDLETLAEIDRLSDKRKSIFDKRTFDKRYLQEQDSKLKNHGYTDEQIKLYKKPLPSDSLEAELAKAQEKILQYERVESGIRERENKVEQNSKAISNNLAKVEKLQDEIKRIQADIQLVLEGNKELELENAGIKDKLEEAAKWISKNEKPSMERLQEQMKEITRHNLEHERISKYREEIQALADKRKEISDADKEIEKIDTTRADLITKSGIPIKGLSFSDDAVTLDGLPLSELQIERSRLMKLSAEIGMELNKELKTIFMQDASLLDGESMDYVRGLCEEKGYQLIVELVSDSEDVEIKFFEEDIKK